MPDAVADDDSGIAPGDRLEELAALLKALAGDYDNSRDDDGRRKAALQQLMAITDYLHGADIPGEDLRPTLALIHSLFDLDRNKLPALLQTQRKKGGSPISFDDLHQRGLVAAAVTFCIRADVGQDEQKLERAVRKVARRIEGWPVARHRRVVKGRRQSLLEAIKDWREKAMSGGSEDLDAARYALMLRLAADDGRSPAFWAEWVLTEGYKLHR
jgi:hypothetical protein